MALSQRHDVADKIVALGGTHYTDLMSLVQYLVVGSRNTEKYRYLVRYRHDVVFVAPDAVLDAHALWAAGDAVPAQLPPLPLFSAFAVCMARTERPPAETALRLFGERFRTPPSAAVPAGLLKDAFLPDEVAQVLALHGAVVSTTLTPACTVVLGTDAAGRRYTMAQQWGIPAVHPLWVYDLCLRGAALDLDDYVVLAAGGNLYNNGLFVWKKLYTARVGGAGKAVLKKSTNVWASIMGQERAPAARLVRDSTWDDEEGTGRGERDQGRDGGKDREEDKDNRDNTDGDYTDGDGVNTDRDRDNADGNGVNTNRNGVNTDRDRANTDRNRANTHRNRANTDRVTHPPDSDTTAILPSGSLSLFLGLRFLAVGFSIPQQKILRRVVESHRGELAPAPDDLSVTHILLLVRNGPQATLMLLMLPSATKRRINAKQVHVVNDWFVERSIFYNSVQLDSWCRPLVGLVPLATRYKVCVSGFTGVELLHIEKLVGYLNLEFCDVLNARRDLLIVNVNLFKPAFIKNSPRLFDYKHKDILHCPVYHAGTGPSVSVISAKNKINAAKKWNIPVVSLAYLWEMIERLANKASLQMPDIVDLQWCIFAPHELARPTTLMDYVRKMSNNFLSQPPPPEVQLPSPRKAKHKLKYGRLAGGGESLAAKLQQAQADGLPPPSLSQKGPDDTNDSDDMPTQVGYENQDSLHDKQELMRKLEEPRQKRRRRV